MDLLKPLPSRTGYVFDGLLTRRIDNASKIISAIASKANVAATAHDLRRSFATRWAKRLPAQALKQLMWHASLSKTLAFYATDDCGLADAVWGGFGDETGDKAVLPKAQEPQESENSR